MYTRSCLMIITHKNVTYLYRGVVFRCLVGGWVGDIMNEDQTKKK